jgi:hypothetical protein
VEPPLINNLDIDLQERHEVLTGDKHVGRHYIHHADPRRYHWVPYAVAMAVWGAYSLTRALTTMMAFEGFDDQYLRRMLINKYNRHLFPKTACVIAFTCRARFHVSNLRHAVTIREW